jgi:hypothetical protein
MDVGIRKYSEICRGKQTYEDKSYKRTISGMAYPVSFLERLDKFNNPITVTEEIYKQEESRFYNEAINNSSYSPSSNRTSKQLSPVTSGTRSPYKPKPGQNRSREGISVPVLSFKKEHLHTLQQINKSTLSPNNNPLHLEPKKFSKLKEKNYNEISSILKACGDTKDLIAWRSKQLKTFINKERLIALKYQKELEWTSDKIREINGHSPELMKLLFDEHRLSHKFYEKEKIMICNKHNTKTSEDFKAKARGMKKFLSDFKNKVIP